MNNKDELLKALESLKETLKNISVEDNTNDIIKKAKQKNKEGIKERIMDSAKFCCTDELDSYVIITNEKTCFSASRFDAINLLMDLIQYLVSQKVLNEKAIRKIVDNALMDNEEFKKRTDELFADIITTLVDDYDNLCNR